MLRPHLERHGLVAPALIELHPGLKTRLDDAEKPEDEDGYLFLFPDGAGGFIQNHRRADYPKGEAFFFDGRRINEMTEDQRKLAKRAREQAKAIQDGEYRMAATACRVIWREAQAADPCHPYLVRKQCGWIAPYLRQVMQAPASLIGWKRMRQVVFPLLLVPGIGLDGELQAIEYIDTHGEKLFHPRARQEGAVLVLAWPQGGSQNLLVAEGLSTGASLAQATQLPCAVAFSAGNLPRVTQDLAKALPGVGLCVCADDDDDERRDSQGRLVPNKGMIKAREAAAAVGARMASPGVPGWDFNDLHLQRGPDAVCVRLASSEVLAAPPPSVEEFLAASAIQKGEQIAYNDIWFVQDMGRGYNMRSGKFLDVSVIDKAIAPFKRPTKPEYEQAGGSKWMKASEMLIRERGVSAAIWAPGEPLIVQDKRLMEDVAWVEDTGARQLNLYRPPRIVAGVASLAGFWVDHLRLLWPNDWEHLVRWFAHRRQRPDEKINHALVLGGSQGSGKDTALEPLKQAVGPWNFREAGPREILHPNFNPYVKSVVLRVSEARDMGESDRFKFYEQMKTLCAAPPDVLIMNDKYVRAVAVQNIVGVVYTTNHKVGGMHMAPDDRRHFVAWTDVTKEQHAPEYFTEFYRWMYRGGGMGHVTAYLDQVDLSNWDAKAPPPKTDAFWEIVLADSPQESGDVADIVRHLGNPDAVTLELLRATAAAMGKAEFVEWGWTGREAKRNRRQLVYRLEEAGYGATKNDIQADGRWRVMGNNMHIYTRRQLTTKQRYAAAQAIQSGNVINIFPRASG
jgi:phage/plasmid primase-like uncharacterized protein